MENASSPALEVEVLYTREQQMELGRQAARTTALPFQSMLVAYRRAVGQHGPLDWMTWTLGYCREVCGSFAAVATREVVS